MVASQCKVAVTYGGDLWWQWQWWWWLEDEDVCWVWLPSLRCWSFNRLKWNEWFTMEFWWGSDAEKTWHKLNTEKNLTTSYLWWKNGKKIFLTENLPHLSDISDAPDLPHVKSFPDAEWWIDFIFCLVQCTKVFEWSWTSVSMSPCICLWLYRALKTKSI